jgi:thiol-disulfide isomerase/thioredoxin
MIPPGRSPIAPRAPRAHLAHRALVFAVAALCAAIVTACGGHDAGRESTAPKSARMSGPIDTAQVVMLPVPPDSISALVRASGGKATLVSVWASWCEPCRMEFPNVVRLAHAYKERGLRVIFISADLTDDLPAARKFLAEEGVDWKAYYKKGDDTAFMNALDSRWTGAIPGSFLYDEDGKLRDFWEGAMNYEGFEQRVLPVLSPSRRGGS